LPEFGGPQNWRPITIFDTLEIAWTAKDQINGRGFPTEARRLEGQNPRHGVGCGGGPR